MRMASSKSKGLRAAATVAGALALLCPPVAVLAGLAAPAAAAGAVHGGVSPVPGDRFAPPGTSVSFRGVAPSALSHLTVAGSKSGVHTGTLRPIAGGGGTVFVPAHPFASGETVSVTTPGLTVDGGRGDTYQFGTSTTPSPAAAAAALKLANAQTPSTSSIPFTPPACPTVSYHSAPGLQAPSLCMNVGVTTSGTQPGSYLFLTPGSGGSGIWDDQGNLVWWLPGSGPSTFNETVVNFQGQPYLAVWNGGSLPLARGVVSLYNEHYQLVGQVTAGSDFASDFVDLHEFQITPQGNALIGIYNTVMVGNETVVQYVVQELSLVQDATGIHTGSVLFEWDSLSDVPTSQSAIPDPGSGGTWDYFHGNAITQDTDGNLVVSARNTWGIYKIDTGSGHVMWTVGASGTSQLSPVPWCFQHDIAALGNNEYSLYDDGGAGPGCVPGSTQHAARGLIFTVNPSANPPSVTLDSSYSHSPSIFTQFTGSTQVLSNGDVLVDWANVPEITEFSSSGAVNMDLSMSGFSYRGFRFAWDGQPLTPPAITARMNAGETDVWASWNGSTEVAAWQLLAGPSPQSLSPVGHPVPKTGFETAMVATSNAPVFAAEALNSNGAVLAVSNTFDASRYFVTTSAGAVFAEAGTPSYGSAAGLRLRAPVTGVASTPSGHGYWLVAGDGGVFTFGDAHYHGSAARLPLRAPIVGIAPTPTGHGYTLTAADGGVFTYGDAHYHGSAARLLLRAPIVGIASDSTGNGYWLIAGDGGVFTYGDARYYGSAAGLRGAAPVVGMAAEPAGGGYWLASSGGQVTWFGPGQLFTAKVSLSAGSRLSGISAGNG